MPRTSLAQVYQRHLYTPTSAVWGGEVHTLRLVITPRVHDLAAGSPRRLSRLENRRGDQRTTTNAKRDSGQFGIRSRAPENDRQT